MDEREAGERAAQILSHRTRTIVTPRAKTERYPNFRTQKAHLLNITNVLHNPVVKGDRRLFRALSDFDFVRSSMAEFGVCRFRTLRRGRGKYRPCALCGDFGQLSILGVLL